jgi:hypothetical protein
MISQSSSFGKCPKESSRVASFVGKNRFVSGESAVRFFVQSRKKQ